MLLAMTQAIHAACFPNFWPNLGGGGLEQAGGIEGIHSMLLQSHESCLRFFPGWPSNGTVSYEKLRARGGFVVSAVQVSGIIGAISVMSEQGRPLHFCVPYGWAAARVLAGGKELSPKEVNKELRSFSVPTTSGTVYHIREAPWSNWI